VRLDFTSALYLGLEHASWSLPPWAALTSGKPAALCEPAGARAVASRLAALQGCESAVLGASTLHLFWELFSLADAARVAIYLDDGAYPIARWGVERAAARGARVRLFAHHDAEALRRQLRRDEGGGTRPMVVADGFCPSCGGPAPLAAYLDCARAYGGCLVIDDTQALGVFGRGRGDGAPYGSGGGGSLRWHDVGGADVLVISSLAKGFGVPVAVLSGGAAAIRGFTTRSETRVHTSPPSAAVVAAAARALAINHACGDELRRRLAGLVGRLRARLAAAGLTARGGYFPVQMLELPAAVGAAELHRELQRAGMLTVLHGDGHGRGARLSLLLTARHRRSEIDRAADALAQAVAGHGLELVTRR